MTKIFDVDNRLKDLEEKLSESKSSQKELLRQIDERFECFRDLLAKKNKELKRKESQLQQSDAEKESFKKLVGRLFTIIHTSTRDPLTERLRALDVRLNELVLDEQAKPELAREPDLTEPFAEPTTSIIGELNVQNEAEDLLGQTDTHVEQTVTELPNPILRYSQAS